MAHPTVDSCFCCCSVKIGTMYIVWLGTVLSMISIFYGLIVGYRSVELYACAGALLLFNACGVCAINERRPACLIPVIALYYILICSLIFSAVFVIFEGSKMGPHSDIVKKYTILIEIVIICAIVISFHFLTVVYSYYKKLKHEEYNDEEEDLPLLIENADYHSHRRHRRRKHRNDHGHHHHHHHSGHC